VWLPLKAGGKPIGTLIGRSSEPLDLGRARMEAATLFAQHTAALLDVAQALRREQRAAITDSLTGLLNRRGFDERLHEEIARAQRTGRPLSIVLIDCDDLKRINDERGHEHGDAALQGMSRMLRESKRLSDIAGRLGGDEFGLILPDSDAASATVVAERLRATIHALADEGMPTASFGIATFPEDGVTNAALMRTADRALYRAKHEGKDRLAVSV
jgi:diguanylate cyclase (GGDEF)-like protein